MIWWLGKNCYSNGKLKFKVEHIILRPLCTSRYNGKINYINWIVYYWRPWAKVVLVFLSRGKGLMKILITTVDGCIVDPPPHHSNLCTVPKGLYRRHREPLVKHQHRKLSRMLWVSFIFAVHSLCGEEKPCYSTKKNAHCDLNSSENLNTCVSENLDSSS